MAVRNGPKMGRRLKPDRFVVFDRARGPTPSILFPDLFNCCEINGVDSCLMLVTLIKSEDDEVEQGGSHAVDE